MKICNINDAKASLSRLIDEALSGQDVVIARAGEPQVRIIPYIASGKERTGGQWRGMVEMREDFDAPLPEELAAAFSGKGE